MVREKLKHYLTLCVQFDRELARLAILDPMGRLCYGRKNIWLVSERGTDARDNGYHFFKYMRQQHPEVPCYYVITVDSPDFQRVKDLGNVVEYRSLKHYLLFFGASYLISTHYMGCTPSRGIYWALQKRWHKRFTRGKQVFLQHGITKDDIPELYQEKTGLDLFICGAKPEYDYISANFHYHDNQVRYTGFCRFDALHDFQVKRQVLIMPTWRRWLRHGTDAWGEAVLRSSYFQTWNSFLNSPELARLAKHYGVVFLFYPHIEMQSCLKHFTTASADIQLADFEHYDVQQLLKESMLLVTDYSSVFFDFAYMRKPVLHYQFDEAEFREKQYVQGYFDYRRDGFGEVVTEEAALLSCLTAYLEGDCRMKPEYQKRIEGFFPLYDTQNSARIYQRIVDLNK